MMGYKSGRHTARRSWHERRSSTTTPTMHTASPESPDLSAAIGRVPLKEIPTGTERNHGGQEECLKCGHRGRQSEVRRRPSTPWLRIVDSSDGFRRVNASWYHAFPVPNLRFSLVDTDVGVVEQRILQNPADGAHPVGGTHDVHVVQGREQTLICAELGLQSLKCGALTKGKHGGHQWVALFTTFCLDDCVDDAIMDNLKLTRRTAARVVLLNPPRTTV